MVIKVESSKRIMSIVFLFLLIWIFLQLLAPVMLPTGSVTNLSGMVGIMDNTNSIDSLPAPWNVVYASGDALCHQREERSLYLNGNQLPFCSRCTALWVGMVFGVGFMFFLPLSLNERFLLVLFLGFTPLVIDGVGQLFGFWESTNIIRMITGGIAGVVCGLAIGLIISESTSIIISNKKTKTN